MRKFDAVVPPTRVRSEDLEKYRERCREKGRSVSEDLRKYIRREGRKAKSSSSK